MQQKDYLCFFAFVAGSGDSASDDQICDEADDEDDEADNLGLLKWTNHQAVCSQRLHKESLQRVEHSVQKQHLSLEFPMIVHIKRYQEKADRLNASQLYRSRDKGAR